MTTELKKDLTKLMLAVLAMACIIAGMALAAFVTYGILRSIEAPTKLWVCWILSLILAAFSLFFNALVGVNK